MPLTAKDHLRRVLDHQEKIEAERHAPNKPRLDDQLEIPLIGEVRRPGLPPAKRGRQRSKKHVQPRLEE